MMINQIKLEEFKQMYLKHYKILLTDQQALDLGTKLIEIFKVIARPILQDRVDKKEVKD